MHTLTLTGSEEKLDAAMQAALEKNNLKLVNRIDGQEKAAMIDVSVDCERVYEIFRPDYAVRVWHACPAAGIEIPLRFHIFRNSNGLLQLNYRLPGDIFSVWQNNELMDLAEELDPLFNALATDFVACMNDSGERQL